VAPVVLLHPHPDFGGDQHNVVIEALWRLLGGAVRFDFASSDVDACVAQAVERLGDGPTYVVGYSFGAMVASLVDDPRVAGWALVAPLAAETTIGDDDRPKLVLLPAHDRFTPPDAARAWTAGWRSTVVEEVPSADHFLAGSTARVAERVRDWIGST